MTAPFTGDGDEVPYADGEGRQVGVEPKTYRYASKRPGDGEALARLRALAAERRRFGYRHLHILLAREGVLVNHKRLFRLYREERLCVRKQGGRKSERLARRHRWRCRRGEPALVTGLRV